MCTLGVQQEESLDTGPNPDLDAALSRSQQSERVNEEIHRNVQALIDSDGTRYRTPSDAVQKVTPSTISAEDGRAEISHSNLNQSDPCSARRQYPGVPTARSRPAGGLDSPQQRTQPEQYRAGASESDISSVASTRSEPRCDLRCSECGAYPTRTGECNIRSKAESSSRVSR